MVYIDMFRKRARLKTFYSVLLLSLVTFASDYHPAFAQSHSNAPIIIRDTEIENAIKDWTARIFKNSNMAQDNVNVVLVQSSQINAFVAGGANIFLYTGLIEKTETPGELIGVFAHELGHISGGHLIRGRAAMERASYESILGMILGVGAAVATGNGQAATAIISGSSSLAASRYLAHSRVNESSADQAAIAFLDNAKIDPSGLVSFFQKLESEELLPSSQQSEYMRTHPLTRNRIQAVENGIKDSPFTGKGWPKDWVEQHRRMKAKLLGFITPEQVSWVYGDEDTSIAARYARAIAAYRNNETDKAVRLINALIQTEPQNPYFLELKGQMLVEFGRVQEALPFYRKALKALPNAPLIRVALGQALVQYDHNDEAALKEGIKHLEIALQTEQNSTRIQRLLATAYGRLGREDIAKLHLAEEAVLQRRFPYARFQVQAALETFPEGSREWLKAKDLLAFIDAQKDARKEP